MLASAAALASTAVAHSLMPCETTKLLLRWTWAATGGSAFLTLQPDTDVRTVLQHNCRCPVRA
eukprot:4391460-Pleurochrysis_carterae.AAC.1